MIDTLSGLTTLADWPVQPAVLIVLVPAIVAALSVVLTRKARVPAFWLALLGSLIGLLAALVVLIAHLRGTGVALPGTIGSLPLEPVLRVPLHLRVDRFSALLSVTVAIVALVVQLFTRWYLREDPRYAGFAATVSLFTAAMQVVVLSDDILLTILGWELMGWCSYLLIGHDSEREKARRAAYKAFLVTRLADAPFAIGLVLLATGAHSTSITAIVAFWTAQPSTFLSAGMIAVIVGVAGKSAQVPFQDWLPDAMEGPTPASALIHAATMVAAGTVVLARLLPLLEVSRSARFALVISAGLSTVLAGFLAYCQTDLKRLLAWSTVSQVGLMLLGLSVMPMGGGPDLALDHLVSHAMFKALLFLMFGWLSVLVGGTVVARMSGSTRLHPATRTLVAIGLLSLAGVPPMAGFISKDLIIDEAATRAVNGDGVAGIAFAALVLSVVLTTAYCMRAWLVIDHRSIVERHAALDVVDDSLDVQQVGIVEMFTTGVQVDRKGNEIDPEPSPAPVVEVEEPAGPPAPDSAARFGLQVLALLAVIGGLVVLTPLLDVDVQHPTWALVAATLLLMTAVAIVVRVQSLGMPYGDAAGRLSKRLRLSADRGFGVDSVYVAIGGSVLALARLVADSEHALDRGVRSSASGLQRLASGGARLQNDTPTAGLIAIALGVLLVGLVGISLW
ncbi:NADH-quinone oxidoreductase subunit L [Dermatophilaceae bacterium Sec6.4]